MKATFFSLFALAASAIASPIAQPAGVNPTPEIQGVRGAVKALENILAIVVTIPVLTSRVPHKNSCKASAARNPPTLRQPMSNPMLERRM
ncbi:uncharacterized protein FPOAC1_013183 [Fusarium poae]|uniref:uncharacterized protein n=1 Tax=Fusarium poae TaxID=36050 RepID=UPI001D04F61B|nr:uncharacterized protein FPOAC1_013908 [Fusarium poae]XP_044701707.1 uncharacterized protein FPOAC1_013183 [Fusarium poae]KAG8664201.1 hypothetical protein FPOAC1_013908 [Fusarium poae]KAG8665204.1 hypothetical protein FPOAC1_013183 [Fusarium poae]